MRRLRPLLPPRRGGVAVAGVAAVALVGGLVLAGEHETYPRTRLVESTGLAWVASDQIGSLTLLDGVSGQPVADVAVLDAAAAQTGRDLLLAGQNGASGYALDQATGRLTRVDGSSYTPLPAPGPPAVIGTGSGTGTGVQLFVGTNAAFVVDGDGDTVSTYDPATLRPTTASRTFAAAGPSSAHTGIGPGAGDDAGTGYAAVLDSAGRLWVLDQATGRLSWFSGSAQGRAAETFPPGAAQLTVAGGEPVVVDTTHDSATLISPGGSADSRVDLGSDGRGSGVAVTGSGTPATGSSAAPAVLITNTAQGTYQSCDLDLDTCDAPRHAAFGADTLGAAVTALGRVFVPDYSTGTVWVLDPGGTTAAVHTGVLAGPGPFDLFYRDGLVFYNDPHDSRAGTLDADGTAKPIVKYSAATASGTANAATASGTATATGTAAAAPATGSTRPTLTAAAPTLSPSRPNATGAGPEGTPSPSPDPTGSRGPAPSCSSATSPSVYDQEGTLMSDNDQSVKDGRPPGEKKEKRPGWDPTARATVLAAVITGVFGLAAVLITISVTSNSPAPAPTAAGGSGTPAATKAAVATAPLPTSAANFPKAPMYDQQDPGGTGVYGVVFTSNNTLATGDLNGFGYLWTLGSSQSTFRLSDPGGQAIFGLAYDPNHDLLAANTTNAPQYKTGSVVLWNTSTDKYVATLTNKGTQGVGSPAAFSPDGKTLASSDANGGIYLWNTTTDNPTPITLPAQSSEPNYEVAFSPTGSNLLAAANGDGYTYLWNTAKPQVVNALPDPSGKAVVAVAFNAKGTILATGGAGGNVDLWNASTGAHEATLPGLAGGTVQSVAFSPRAQIVAATIDDDSTKTYEFCIWNTQGTLLATRVDAESIGATKLTFSPNGNELAVADENDSTYIWDVSGIG